MHGISPASPISEPLVTAKSDAMRMSVNDGGIGGVVKSVVDINSRPLDSDNDVMIRSLLSRPLVSLLPPNAVSSTSIKLSWKVIKDNYFCYNDFYLLIYFLKDVSLRSFIQRKFSLFLS